MKELELIFGRGGLDRCRPLLTRLAAVAPVVRLTFDAERNRALLVCPDAGEAELLAAIWALELPLVALLLGVLRDADPATDAERNGERLS